MFSAPFFGIVIDAVLFDGCGAWCIVTMGSFCTHKAVLFLWACRFFPLNGDIANKRVKIALFPKHDEQCNEVKQQDEAKD